MGMGIYGIMGPGIELEDGIIIRMENEIIGIEL
jgi:hypothetical protein